MWINDCLSTHIYLWYYHIRLQLTFYLSLGDGVVAFDLSSYDIIVDYGKDNSFIPSSKHVILLVYLMKTLRL